MLVERNPDHRKASAFFGRILSHAPPEASANLVVIAHLVDSAIPFIPALDQRFKVLALLGKPSSIQPAARDYLAAAVPDVEFELDKTTFRQSPERVFQDALPALPPGTIDSVPVILLDIGGYFAPETHGTEPALIRIQKLLAQMGYHLAGIVEDTENGHKRYKAALEDPLLPDGFSFSVFSVARSPLKKPENHLVGVAVTFSIEALLRKSNIVLQSRRAGVIGFGPIGRSVAHALRGRSIPVSICEIDPIKLAQAAAQGFRVFHYEHHFDDFARDLNLVVSATGAGADARNGTRPLDAGKVSLLRSGSFVASVTSNDDEMDLESIRQSGYVSSPLSYNEDVSKWTAQSDGGRFAAHSFYLMLGGDAVNFKHEGVIGPAIQLLQGEVAACVAKILTGHGQGVREVQELLEEERKLVASAWLDQYLVDSAVAE